MKKWKYVTNVREDKLEKTLNSLTTSGYKIFSILYHPYTFMIIAYK